MPRSELPRLIATDLDGTLVRSDDTVSAYTREVLARVRAAGIPVVGCTGRGPRLLQVTRRHIPTADHLVMAGGGRVVALDGGTPTVLRDLRLSGPDLAAALADLEAVTGPLTLIVEALDGPDAPLWSDTTPTWPWPNRIAYRPRGELLRGPLIKAFIRDERDTDELLAIAREVVPPEVASVTQAGLGYVEVCPPGADKGTGLAVVANALGVDPSEVLVFGDMPNDVPMFEWAGWCRVAVGNAHPEVRARADEVTLTNDEDGVAVWLARLLEEVGGHPAEPAVATPRSG